ncbi:uncharacterized protein TrAtP1_000702 [Trichoderma atroviride]|uniref:uncharacterized protein n=1 Tax=Hypocrea atroviridis TaxID=63577 RepID=UPI00332C8AC8|nr:hypothetical protein TrAtP1_000702 [Trichoderma atroviride]
MARTEQAARREWVAPDSRAATVNQDPRGGQDSKEGRQGLGQQLLLFVESSEMGHVVQHDGFDPGVNQHLVPFGRRPRHGKVKMLSGADGARVNFESYQRNGIRMPWSCCQP